MPEEVRLRLRRSSGSLVSDSIASPPSPSSRSLHVSAARKNPERDMVNGEGDCHDMVISGGNCHDMVISGGDCHDMVIGEGDCHDMVIGEGDCHDMVIGEGDCLDMVISEYYCQSAHFSDPHLSAHLTRLC